MASAGNLLLHLQQKVALEFGLGYAEPLEEMEMEMEMVIGRAVLLLAVLSREQAGHGVAPKTHQAAEPVPARLRVDL